MKRDRIALLMAVVIGMWGCGGGSGPGVTPADDAAGPEDVPQDIGQDAGVETGPDSTPPCLSDAECDDDNPCSKDTCEADGCHHQPLVSGACDDGDPCTEGESCQYGVCQGGEFVCECLNDADCGPGSDDCHQKRCDLATHACVEEPRPDETPCDDQNPCTEGEACWGGACQGGADVCECEKDEDCLAPVDACSPLKCDLTEHKCQADPRPDGTACDDKNACTLGDQCQGGKCKSGAPKDCDDKDGCTKDSCNQATGECVNEYQALPGCCASDGECDDHDPCTVESCVKHRCERKGENAEPSSVGCASVDGCSAGFCSEETGTCRTLSVDMPSVLFDWDFTTGQAPKGMRWVTESGEVTVEGAGPKVGEGVAVFAFPAHFVAKGVRVLHVTLGEGLDCGSQGKVLVRSDGGEAEGAKGCAMERGRAVLGFVFKAEETSRLDLEVLVQAGARVARATLYLHAVPSCKPLGPATVVSGTNLSDLSVGGTPTVIGLGHRFANTTILLGRYSLWDGVKNKTTLASTMEAHSKYHRASLLSLAGDRFLVAYDGSPGPGKPSLVRVALVNRKGEVVGGGEVPRKDQNTMQYEPFLVGTPSGEVHLAYTSSDADSDGLGVRFVRVTVSGDEVTFGTAVTLNASGEGDQTLPVLAWSDSSGVAVWKSWNPSVVKPSSIRLRHVSATGTQGPEYEVVKSSDLYPSLTVQPAGDYIFVAATTSDGVLKGFRLLKDLSADPTVWTGVPPEGEWYDVTLLPGPAGGVLLLGTYLKNGVAKVVQAKVSSVGAMGGVVAVSNVINSATASPTPGAFGPFLWVLAFNDTLSATKGAKAVLLSGLCADGPVTCQDNIPRVCTGLGGTGYISVPWTNAWCQ